MNDWTPLEQLIIGCSAGAALVAIAIMRMLTPSWIRPMRWMGYGCIALVAAVAAARIAEGKGVYVFGITLLGGCLAILAQTAWLSLPRPLATALSVRHIGTAIIAFVGLSVGLLTLWHEERRAELQDQADSDFAAGLSFRPPLRTESRWAAITDGGSPVVLATPITTRSMEEMRQWEIQLMSEQWYQHVMSRQPADDRCNCHGWVFTGGKYWISDHDVEIILCENGYYPVEEPLAGDIVIYRDEDNDHPVHTGLVRGNLDLGIMVESKWGPLGVYLHFAHLSRYGENMTFYRSARSGHVLKGLNDVAEPEATIPVLSAE